MALVSIIRRYRALALIGAVYAMLACSSAGYAQSEPAKRAVPEIDSSPPSQPIIAKPPSAAPSAPSTVAPKPAPARAPQATAKPIVVPKASPKPVAVQPPAATKPAPRPVHRYVYHPPAVPKPAPPKPAAVAPAPKPVAVLPAPVPAPKPAIIAPAPKPAPVAVTPTPKPVVVPMPAPTPVAVVPKPVPAPVPVAPVAKPQPVAAPAPPQGDKLDNMTRDAAATTVSPDGITMNPAAQIARMFAALLIVLALIYGAVLLLKKYRTQIEAVRGAPLSPPQSAATAPRSFADMLAPGRSDTLQGATSSILAGLEIVGTQVLAGSGTVIYLVKAANRMILIGASPNGGARSLAEWDIEETQTVDEQTASFDQYLRSQGVVPDLDPVVSEDMAAVKSRLHEAATRLARKIESDTDTNPRERSTR